MTYSAVKIRSYIRAFCRSDRHQMCSGVESYSPSRFIVCACSCHQHDSQPDTTLDQLQAKIQQYREYLQAMIAEADRAAQEAFDRGTRSVKLGDDSRVHDLSGVRHQARANTCLEILTQLDRLLYGTAEGKDKTGE